MTFKELAEKRYSCRKLSSRPVEKELLDQIIETAIKAPTAHNEQPYKIFVMNSEKAKADIRSVTTCTFGADTFLVVGAKEDASWVRPCDGKKFAEVDASIIATHIMLSITDVGLDTTWVGYFDSVRLKELYPCMRDYELIAIFPIGYAEEGAHPAHLHFDRKSRAELVEEL